MFQPEKVNGEKKEEAEEDPISVAIGEYGRWQLLVTFLLSLFNIPCTWHIFVPTFHAAPREFWCSPPDHLQYVEPHVWREFSQPSGPCQILNVPWENITSNEIINGTAPDVDLIACTKWTWANDGANTVVSEWQLVCDREDMISTAEMVFLAGVALGGLVSGVISDHYGRKNTLMASVLIQTITGILIAFTPWYYGYLVLRAVLGFISVGVVFSGFVLSLEVVGGVWRMVAGVSYLFPVSLSYVSVAGIAWCLRKWRYLQLAVSLPGALFLLLWWVLPESPRWLLAMGRHKQVMRVLQKAAAFNGKELPAATNKRISPCPTVSATVNSYDNSTYNRVNNVTVSVNTTESLEHKNKPKKEETAGLADLFRTPRMRNNTICLFIIWFSVYLVYYGLVLNMGNLGGDLYLNSVLSGLVEIPALAASVIFLVRMGRRWPLCLTLALAGISCLLTLAPPPELQWLRTTLAMLGKFSISSSNAVMPVFTAELYPTVIRNLGVGASNVSAGIALMLVPYLWKLSNVHQCVPMTILGVCGIIGGLCVLLLPETGNKPLVGTMKEEEEVENREYHHQLENHRHNQQNEVSGSEK